MANTTGGDKILTTPWTAERGLRFPAATPTLAITFYAGQAIGRDASGNGVQMDDTAAAEFVGVLASLTRPVVDNLTAVFVNGVSGEILFQVIQPVSMTVKIAAAAGGDEGKNVYWKFNNEVQYLPGSYGNIAGVVWRVKDSTHVEVIPPWAVGDLIGTKGAQSLAGSAAAVQLTKFDAGKTIVCAPTVAQVITLPLLSQMGSGNRITFVNNGTGAFALTLAGKSSDLINGVAQFSVGSAQFSKATVEAAPDLGNWFVVG